MIKTRSIAAGHLAAVFSILIWGTTFVSTKVLLEDFSAYEILFFRFILCYIALFLTHPHFIKTKNLKEEILFLAAGFSGVTMYFLLQTVALTYTLSSNVGIIVSVAPFFTAVLAHFFLKGEPLRPQVFFGFIVAMAGITLIIFNGSFILKLNPKGDILAVLACLFWAVYSILMRKVSELDYNNTDCTRRVFFYGTLFLIPALMFSDFHLGLVRFSKPANVLNLLFLGLGASALCFVIWNWSISVLGAAKTSIYIYLIPVINILVSYLILHEKLTGTALIGTLLTLAGLSLSEINVRKKPNVEKVNI